MMLDMLADTFRFFMALSLVASAFFFGAMYGEYGGGRSVTEFVKGQDTIVVQNARAMNPEQANLIGAYNRVGFYLKLGAFFAVMSMAARAFGDPKNHFLGRLYLRIRRNIE